MILSVSRRTDVPGFYSDWFYNRVKEGFVYVRNPMNYHQVSVVPISPELVDCFVFWTKDPSAMIPGLDNICQYPYYFQFTLNPYNQSLEKAVSRKTHVIDTFRSLVDKIGNRRVIWRYDPVFMTDKIDLEYHIHSFELIAERLKGYTKRCMIGFLDMYRKTAKNMETIAVRSFTEEETLLFAKAISTIGKSYGIEIQSCTDELNLSAFDISNGKCIDDKLIEEITGHPLMVGKDKNQRILCKCVESIDIGEYDTCPHHCLYCYANHSRRKVMDKIKNHYPDSPFLIGNIEARDKVTERKVRSLRRKDLFSDL